MAREMPPFLVEPRYVPKPWGGRRLETVLGRRDLPDGPIGESWEVGSVPGWEPRVDGGPLAGRTLAEAWGGPFPLLLKILDAREDLSVQVHPDGRDGVDAKEEAWIPLSDAGSVALGRLDVDSLPAPGRWIERLDVIGLKAAAGDQPPSIVHVPAGAVHAILADSLVFEIQTPVDVTWRLDDHGRMGLDGTPRDLHLAEARAVLARGGEEGGHLADGGRTLEGLRLRVETRPPGTWEVPAGVAAFFPEGGEVVSDAATLEVPRARTAVLPPGVSALRSTGWTIVATPSRPCRPGGGGYARGR